ncbi:MAG: hypothetical protein ACYTFA_18255, partial [Planctomycetota bacterium]
LMDDVAVAGSGDMCDLADSNACYQALEPQLPRLALKYPRGGVYAYKDAAGSIRARAESSYETAEAKFAGLLESEQAKGILVDLAPGTAMVI